MTEKTRPGVKEIAAAFFLKVKEWYTANFAHTESAVHAVALVVSTVIFTVWFADMYWPTAIGYCASFAVIFILLWLASWIIPKILRKFFKYGLRSVLSAAMLSVALYEFIRRGAGEGHVFRVAAVTALVFCAIWLFTVTACKMLSCRRFSPTTVLTAVLSAAVLVCFGWMVNSPGFDSGIIDKYTALTENMDLGNGGHLSVEAGQYEVCTLDYGTENGIESDEVSIAPYMTRDNAGFNGIFAEYYLGYTLRSVPLIGRVWYPKNAENCPVLFIAHGNHKITVPSYEGYEYLATYLASHGYVVVSVDQNACNLMTGENDARAMLLLKHVGQVLEYNSDEDNPLYGVIDENSIALAGHSRGGEIVATAYLFNGYDRYPENGTIRFSFDYSIKSLIALAPTANQYEPADHSVEIEDVNYLLLHGMQDADVKKVMGMTQYENVTFTGNGEYIKSALYIGGANHGQFNSLWGRYDRMMPHGALLNTADFIDESEQQKIASLFVKTFLDVTLKGDNTNKTLLTNWDAYDDSLPDTVYTQRFQSTDYVPIADFEEDSDLETGTAENVSIFTSGVSVWTEEFDGVSGGEDNHTLRFKWSKNGNVKILFPTEDVSGYELTFDIADIYDEAVENGNIDLLDGKVTLTDTDRNSAEVRISEFAAIYPTLPVYTDKLDYVFGTEEYRHSYSTVNIPVSKFNADSSFDPTKVMQISISFEGAGEVIIDNIGWNK